MHGGIAPAIVDAGLSVADLNQAMRRYWMTEAGSAVQSAALDGVLGTSGVTQYRGYVRGLDGTYPLATSADVERVLAHFGARRIVVAHTVVERIELLHGGRVYAVDVNDNDARQEVLVLEQGVASAVDLAVPRGLQDDPAVRTRGFSLLDAGDRRLLRALIGAYGELSALPQPY